MMSRTGGKKTVSDVARRSAEPPLRLVLHVQHPDGGSPKILAAHLKPRLIMGRSSADTPVPIDIDLSPFDAMNTGVSRIHAAFHYLEGKLEIEDLESTNGTRINGFPLQPGKRYRLRVEDELECGRLQISVKVVRTPQA